MSHTLLIWRRLAGVLVVTLLLCIAPAVQRATRMVNRDNAAAPSGQSAHNVFTLACDPLDAGVVAMDPLTFRLGIYEETAAPVVKKSKLAPTTQTQDAPAAADAEAVVTTENNPAVGSGVFAFPTHSAPQVLGLIASTPGYGVYGNSGQTGIVDLPWVGGENPSQMLAVGSLADPFQQMDIANTGSSTSSSTSNLLVARPSRHDARANGANGTISSNATPAVVPLPSAVWSGGISLIFAALVSAWVAKRRKPVVAVQRI